MSPSNSFISRFSDAQTLPFAITHLSRLMADENATMKQFEEVITMDPVLVVRLLKLVNSPYYGLLHKVDSVSRAITLLGMKNLHNIAVTESLKVFFIDLSNATVFSRHRLWLHCAAVAICAKMVAERIFGINGDDAYLTGILHDFGLIIEEQVEPEAFWNICQDCSSTEILVQRERVQFGTDHTEVTDKMLASCAMPEQTRNAIRNHHTALDDIEPNSLTGILQIAEYLTATQGYTALDSISPGIAPALQCHIEENIDEYTVLIEDFPEEMIKAKDLYSIGS